MSRIIVKNLPAYLSDVRLKDHFSSQGATVTDTKILRRRDGTSRQFGFVGFKSEQEAHSALQYFHRTFIDTSRIDVGIAKSIQDAAPSEEKVVAARTKEAVTADKKAAKGITLNQREDEKKKTKNAKGVSFDEFMAIMAPKKKRKVWQNEEGEDGETRLNSKDFEPEAVKEKSKKKQKRNESGILEIEELKMALEGDGEEGEDKVLNDEGMTDIDYMYKRMKRKVGEDLEEADKKFDQSDSEAEDDGDENVKDSDEESIDEEHLIRQQQEKMEMEEKAKKDQENVDAIMTSGRIFVRNLPFSATEEELEDYFSRYGAVTQVSILLL